MEASTTQDAHIPQDVSAQRPGSPLPPFDASQRLRVLACPQCGVVFAMPVTLHLERVAASGTVHCPNGHAHQPARESAATPDLLRANIALLLEAQQLRHELDAALRRPTSPPADPLGVLDKRELRRRSRIEAERAEQGAYGRRICRFCGCLKAGGKLAEHIRRQHPGLLAEEEAVHYT